MNATIEENQLTPNESSTPLSTSPVKTRNLPFGMAWWEAGAIVLSFILITYIAIPGYFRYLDYVRGKESSNRLTLIANCLKYLADQNKTKPGEKICEIFDLNETLEMAQRQIYTKMNIDAERAIFLKIGAEPDCPGGGDYGVNLFLGADGNIVVPTCTLVYGPKGDYYKKNGLYIADMSKVNGDLGLGK